MFTSKPMITLSAFNLLTNEEKFKILETKAVYLSLYRLTGTFKIALFQMNGYYIEVWLNTSNNDLFKAVAFDDYGLLDSYIEKVDIRAAFACLR